MGFADSQLCLEPCLELILGEANRSLVLNCCLILRLSDSKDFLEEEKPYVISHSCQQQPGGEWCTGISWPETKSSYRIMSILQLWSSSSDPALEGQPSALISPGSPTPLGHHRRKLRNHLQTRHQSAHFTAQLQLPEDTGDESSQNLHWEPGYTYAILTIKTHERSSWVWTRVH